MLHILRSHRTRAASQRTADALEAVLDTYHQHLHAHAESAHNLTQEAERILNQNDKDAPHDSRNP